MTVKFGVTHITKETPMWATWMFRIIFALTTVAIFVVASDPAILDATKVRIGVYLKAFETLIFTLSKMFGVDVNTAVQDNGDGINTPVNES